MEDAENTVALNEARAGNEIEEYTGEEKIAMPEKPTPNAAEMMIFLGLALVVDGLGAIADLSLIFAIPVRIITLPMVGALWLWRALKKDKTNYLLGLGLAAGTEALLSILPAWTAFVLYIWYRDSKMGQATIGKLAKAGKATK